MPTSSLSTFVYVDTHDRWRLGMRVYRAAGSARGAVLCGHAMMTDGAYFDRPRGAGFASWLAGQGYDVFVPDFRGHGLSRPHTDQGARWSFDDLVDFDWPALRRAAAEEAGCRVPELSVIGHSLGGLVVAADAARSGYMAARTVFLTTNIWYLRRMPMGVEKMRARALLGLLAAPARLSLPFPARRLGIGNTDEAPQYVRQFVSWCESGHFASQLGVDFTAGLRGWNRPAVAVAGDGDWMCPPSGARRFVAPAEGAISLVTEGRMSGLPFAPNHFQLLTRQVGNAFHERLLGFLETGRYPGT